MKLKLSFETKKFSYTTPVTVGSFKVAENQALAITVNKTSQVTLTALPHFHHYSIFEWQSVLTSFFENHDISTETFDQTQKGFGLAEIPFSGELLYAIEAVLFAAFENLFPKPEIPVRINGLYSEEMPFDSVLDCVKIKIRPGKSAAALKAMNVCLAQNPNTIFRLDGNRTFEIESLLEFLRGFPVKSIQYIEEPFKNFADRIHFKKISSIPLALDESLLFHLNDLKNFRDDFFIVKPSLLGLSKSFELAASYPEQVILSSSYETASAMKAFSSVAALLPAQYHGFDTIKFLPKEFSN